MFTCYLKCFKCVSNIDHQKQQHLLKRYKINSVLLYTIGHKKYVWCKISKYFSVDVCTQESGHSNNIALSASPSESICDAIFSTLYYLGTCFFIVIRLNRGFFVGTTRIWLMRSNARYHHLYQNLVPKMERTCTSALSKPLARR
jgi:hypothetical protein